MVFYQMFRFVCGKNEVKDNEEQKNTDSIKFPPNQKSQKMSNKYKPMQSVKEKYTEKIPNIERTKPSIEAFIRNYNEIQKMPNP